MRIPIKKERIFRLLATGDNLSVSKISQKTSLAKSYISETLKELEKNNVVWGTEIIQVDNIKLMREWGNLKRKIFQYIKPLMIDILIPERIKTVVKDYAISGPFGEMLIQGESPGKPVIVYLTTAEMDKKKNQISILGNTGKGQVWFYVYDQDILSSRWEIRGWNIVSIPQLCADLIGLGTYADLGMSLYKKWLYASKRV